MATGISKLIDAKIRLKLATQKPLTMHPLLVVFTTLFFVYAPFLLSFMLMKVLT